MHTTPSTAGWILASRYQFKASSKAMFKKHETYLYSDLNELSSRQKKRELKGR